MPATSPTRSGAGVAAALLLGVALAVAEGAGYVGCPPAVVPATHENWSYVYRLVEFRDLLAAGYWSPQWATHFHGGLGSPYFSYYQPGFFYVASLIPWRVDPVQALGWAVSLYALVGFTGMLALIGSRLGTLAGTIAGVVLLLAPYPRADLYVRGDLSEYGATMIVPLVLHGLLAAFTPGRPRDLALLALATGALVCTHPCVTLLMGGVLGGAWLVLSAVHRDVRASARAATALVAGGMLAAFYLFPLAFEANLASVERAGLRLHELTPRFLTLRDLLGENRGYGFMLGPIPALAGVLGFVSLWLRGLRDLTLVLGLALVLSCFITNGLSAPLWDLPVVHYLQIPYRALGVGTVAVAGLAGGLGLWRRAGLRWIAGGLVLGSLLAVQRPLLRPAERPYLPLGTAADMMWGFFEPDVLAEWVPRDAAVFGPRDVPIPLRRDGDCVVPPLSLVVEAGCLSVPVGPAHHCNLVFPHYYFPVGWSATIDGRPAPVFRAPSGLLAVAVATDRPGRLEVRFGMTPMRRRGLLVSLAVLVAGSLWLAAQGLRRRRLPVAGLR